MSWKIGGLALSLLSGWVLAASPAEACTPLRIALDGDADAVVIECPDPAETTKVCIGEKVCVNQHGQYQYPANGTCNTEGGYAPAVVGAVDEACKVAKSLTPEPDSCREGCVDQGVQTTSARENPCCTVTKTRICSPPPPPPPPHQDAEEAMARL
jgi:hypothetical protein